MFLRNMSTSVIYNRLQSVQQLILNKPASLNALDLPMIDSLYSHLKEFENSNSIKLFILMSDPSSRAFCAGGDVKRIVEQASTNDPIMKKNALSFFEREYILNHLIGTSKKPFVSILNGITMGGGVGISVHGHFRIITEKTVFAMPETSIGLFPDVGGSFFLPRLDGSLGTYLGLTGHALKGHDVLFAGIGTHYMHSSRLPSLLSSLSQVETDNLDVVNGIIDDFSEPFEYEKWRNWSLGGETASAIHRCFQSFNLADIVIALEKEGSEWSKKQLDILKSSSPTSLKVTLKQLEKGATMDFASCFRMEYNIVHQFLSTPDFINGVTCKLIKKPRENPIWSPTWQEIDSISVDSFFKKNGIDLPLPRSAPTFKTYPHKSLSGFPTTQDVLSVRELIYKSKGSEVTRQDIIQWFELNWSCLNLSFNTSNIKGYGRGKVGLQARVDALLDQMEILA